MDFGRHKGHTVRLIAHAAADYRQVGKDRHGAVV